ncbi:endoribonuclease l-psp [Chrysochromulina tobinii]|uniref:Endoribonuclease l-psp n=1 Tax=Chrysochromulina tobinii TaxID=1460289 RepID=A0A0M0JCX1_9EUKA|nr:endoribonuclease l-psp [Chrysochromulina tobinii]|eukprot:KOO24053.1 endoribonuclease l-psp [Chrysochromulina sp. CCMP291]
MCIPKTVDLTGVTAAVSTERSGSNTFVTLDWSRIMGTLPFKIPFCSATLCDDGTIYVSGTIGLRPVSADGESQAPSIVKGGPMAEARRTMEIIEATLKACGATLENITMVHVYLVDNTKERFAEMNEGYLQFWGDRPLPARITVGCSALALGSCVEIDVIAKK